MATATLSTKFQISIPKEVREQQHWSAGQEFVFIPKGKGVLLMPVPTLADLRGLAEGADNKTTATGTTVSNARDRQLRMDRMADEKCCRNQAAGRNPGTRSMHRSDDRAA